MKFEIQADGEKVPLLHFWNGSGFSPGSLLLNADMQQQMAYAGSIPFQGIRYIRIHYLLDLVSVENFETENPKYQWNVLDTCIDVLITHNLLPFFELMGNPSNCFNDFTDASQVNKWKNFVFQLVTHFIERHGMDSVVQWYFETWNEPDGNWWKQSEEAFCNYYDACSEGLKMVSSDLRLGGPGTCMGNSSIFRTFLAHCDTGTNYFTKEKGVRLDFISVHEKGAHACVEDVNPNSRGIVEREQALHDYIVSQHPRFSNIPFINNECDPQVGWWDTHTWRAKAYNAALVVKIIAQHIELFLDRGVNYAMLSNDNGFVGSWGRRTMMARFGLEEDKKAQHEYEFTLDELKENPKRRKFAMVKKPVLSVMTMLSMLGTERLPIRSDSPSSSLGVMATMHDNSQLALLVFNSSDIIMSSGEKTIEATILGIPFSEGILSEYRIESGYTDPFSIWEQSQFPQIPDVHLLKKMRDEAELQQIGEGKRITLADGELTIKTTIPLPSVRLFLFTKKSDEIPDQIENPKTTIFDGLDDAYEDVLVSWPGINTKNLKTYEVFYKPKHYKYYYRINDSDTQCSLWLHTRKKNEKGEYRIRAVTFSDRCSTITF